MIMIPGTYSNKFAGHLDFAGFYFCKCPANSKCPAKFVSRYQFHPAFLTCYGGSPTLNILYLPGLEHAPPLTES